MSFILSERSNDALRTNPSNANRNLSTGGSNWLWAVTAIFALSFLSWLIWSFILKPARHSRATEKTTTHSNGAPVHNASSNPRPERIFHYLWTIAAFAGLVAYFTMASNLGNTSVRQYIKNGGNPNQTRQMFYARYIYWFVAWPMVVIAMLLLSGVSWATILFAVAILEFWVVTWLCGALVSTDYRWGYYAIGIVAYLVLSAILLHWGRISSRRLSQKHYVPLAATLVFVWSLYLVAWGLSEGSNRLSITREMIFYGILDLISVPLLGFVFLALSRKWDHDVLHLHYTQGRVRDHGYSDHQNMTGDPSVHGHHDHHNGAIPPTNNTTGVPTMTHNGATADHTHNTTSSPHVGV